VSHVVTIEAEARDLAAIAAACRRLGLPEPVRGTAKLFEGEATGLLVRLPGWLYPAVVEPATGKIRYDNFGGSWGDPAQLGRFLQAYALEKAAIEARKEGVRRRRAGPGRRLGQADRPGRGWRMKSIEITVDKDGRITVETKGFAGGSCREASRFVEEALGARTSERMTAEFYQGQDASQDLRQPG